MEKGLHLFKYFMQCTGLMLLCIYSCEQRDALLSLSHPVISFLSMIQFIKENQFLISNCSLMLEVC